MAEQTQFDVAAFKQFESDGYSRVADAYNRASAPITAQAHAVLLDAAGATSGTRVLDVACGPGWLSAAALERGAVVTGIDFAPGMLMVARARCPGTAFRDGDAEALPFNDGEFDAVVCNLGFPHFANPGRAISEAFRVLIPGGRFAFTCWAPPTRNPLMALVLGSVQAHGTMDVDLPAGPPPFRFGEPDECQHALASAGFASISVRELPVKWTFAGAEQVVPALVSATVRLGTLLEAQPDAQREAVESAIRAGAAAWATGAEIAIPAPMILATAEKPG